MSLSILSVEIDGEEIQYSYPDTEIRLLSHPVKTVRLRAYKSVEAILAESIHDGANEFARGNQHINGIESIWNFTKRKISRFNGIKKSYFYYSLKEYEFRYNCRINWKDIYKEILKLLRITSR